MRNYLLLLFFLSQISLSQNKQFQIEYNIGQTNSSNSYFPDLKNSHNITLGFGIQHKDSLKWVQKLRNPYTGLLLQITNHGNLEKIGTSISLMPYIDKPILFKNNRLRLLCGIGASYHTKKYDESLNWENKAISTTFTWGFRLGTYYTFYKFKNLETRANLNYFHYSNGHIQWPNNGINTFSIGLNLNYIHNNSNETNSSLYIQKLEKTPSKNFFSIQTSIGQHALYRFYNFRRNVYALDVNIGKIFDRTHKVGLGIYFRNYQNNYQYIKEDNNLVSEEYAYLKKNPLLNSSSMGIALNYEFLMQHFAIESELGLTFFRPFFAAEYRLNKTLINNQTNQYEIGKAEGSSYHLKKLISGKLGLKYYLLNTYKLPKNNFYFGTHIVSILGQADYTEFSLGYLHSF